MKGLKKAAVCALSLVMTGCAGTNFNVDGLLNAPKLTSEQSEIHQALIESVGSNITIKYPKNGQNRSAYVIANIDDEPGDEALVFYKYSSEDSTVRVNLLDKDDNGDWYSVKELKGAGSDIDRVIITDIGGSNSADVIVGYQSVSDENRTLEVYDYAGGKFGKIGASGYSVLDTADINADGKNEIITVAKESNADNGEVTAKASLLKLKDGELIKDEEIDMCPNMTSYAKTVVGGLKSGRTGLYIDSLNGDGKLATELIYYRYSKLQNPMQSSGDKLLNMCTRPSGYYSVDLDGDGVVEIPSVAPMTGYENAVEDEMVYMTSWNAYVDFYDLEKEYEGFYSVSDGYFVSFPERWKDMVTVKKDNDSGEYVFYKYNGDINSDMSELMRIVVCTRKKSQDHLEDGYEIAAEKGQMNYLVKLSDDKDEKLVLTIDEVKNNFYVIN